MSPHIRALFVPVVAVPVALLVSAGLVLPSGGGDAPGRDSHPRRPPAGRVTSGAPAARMRARPECAPDEVLVAFREGTAEAAARASLRAAGHTVLRRFRYRRNPEAKQNRRYLVRIGPGRGLDEALEAIRRLPGVEEAQPNFIYHALQAPDDFYYDLQWGLHNAGNDAAFAEFGLRGPDPRLVGADMAFEDARAVFGSMTFDPVIVGVIDSGIDAGHPDLSEVVWQNPGEIPGNGVDDDGNGYADDINGWDFAYNDDEPADGDGHGTHVSGVIGAVGDNGIGVSGIAPDVTLMPLKFLDDSGSGYTADAIDAIYYGIDNGARVLNNSWGGGGFDQALFDAIGDAAAAGILFVAAAGNDATDGDANPEYPSAYDLDNIVSVAASTPWGDLADFSNWGRVSVDLAAPGDEIISTTPTDGADGVPETAYQIGVPTAYPGIAPWSGTSMATPAVSGAAALLFGLGDTLWPGEWPILSPAERMTAVRDRLLKRSARWASLSGTSVTDGHLNLYNLVEDDTAPPDPVGASFEPVAIGARFVTLRWTATGDDGATGTANFYDLRYQPGPAIDFDTATPAEGVWTPAAPGSLEHFTLTGLQPDTGYTLGLEAVDNAGNRSGRTDLSVTTLPDAPLFADDMESGANGWTATGDWALTTEEASSPTHSWTDSPGGLYFNHEDASLTSPEIPAGGSPLGLSFMHRYDTERDYDFCYVQARAFTGGQWGPWSDIDAFTGTGPGWSGYTAAIPVSGDSVQIRFRLVSDHTVQADGWHVDDVTVFSTEGMVPDTLLFEDTFDGDDCSQWSLAGEWGCESDTLSDSPGADYPINNRASAGVGPLSLAGTRGVEVSFDLPSFDYESGYDFLFFEYSLDGTSWRRIGRYTGTLSGTQTYALNKLAGLPAVYFRFLSLSDYGISHPGARIDNFRVMVAEPAGCAGDAECDDGLFCNGAETCDTGTGTCAAGTPPAVDDGVSCTVDSCDESTDTVVHLPDDALCDDGDICTTDSCDPLADCTAVSIPGCADADGDGVEDALDNCTAAPNGPAAGTCVSGSVGAACLLSAECTSENEAGLCSLNQEDLDGDGVGDACDPDQDGDGYAAASGDCDDRAAPVHPGADEVCDGLDNDCDGTADNVPPPAVVALLTLANDTLSWTPVAGAAVYDVAAGDLDGLATAGMAAVTSGCVAEDAPSPSVTTQATPPPGGGFWFVVRGAHCGGSGSYGSADPPQPQSRDQAIAASGNDCAP